MTILSTCYVCKTTVKSCETSPKRKCKITYCSQMCREIFKDTMRTQELLVEENAILKLSRRFTYDKSQKL